MSLEQAIQILENQTGYQIVCDDCDTGTVYEAIQTVVKEIKRKQ